MTPLEAAMRYAGKLGWPIFPRPGGKFIKDGAGWKDATRDPDIIARWWRRWPEALIAMPTGTISGVIVLDIDRKNGKDGFEALERLGRDILPTTPLAYTPHDGVHVYFAVNPSVRIAKSESLLGAGLDVLGEGTSVALPTPGWRYRWDKGQNLSNTPLTVAPAWFARQRPQSRTNGYQPLDPHKLLQDSCAKIRSAGQGVRHAVLNREAFLIGCVVARGALKEADARHELEAAAAAIMARDFNARQAGHDLADAFKAGLRKGRKGR